jgi:hypothetical protein
MTPLTRFAVLALIPLGCATGENTGPGELGLGTAGTDSVNGTAGTDSGSGGSSTSTAGTSGATAGTGTAGTETASAGTFATAGTFGAGGTSAGLGGTNSTAGSGGASSAAGTNGTAGKAAGGTTGTAGTGAGTAGTNGAAGTNAGTAYCDTHAKSPLPYTVNEGFQPSGWQGDSAAISAAPVAPDNCAAAARTAGAVGNCSTWRYTPNATAPLWAGVAWSRVWDANTTHEPVCLAAGATKITFQARGAAGGEKVTFSAAGAAELQFTLTNAWKEYEIPLAGVVYNTPAEGVSSGFFWKVVPPTPNGAPVTFFVDDIQFVN